MKPMKPMKPMDSMAPMEPMPPMTFCEKPWWPSDLGDPSTTGSQESRRYAFFPEKRRLVIEEDGSTAIYDSGDREIDGVLQGDHGRLQLSTRAGLIGLDQLARLD